MLDLVMDQIMVNQDMDLVAHMVPSIAGHPVRISIHIAERTATWAVILDQQDGEAEFMEIITNQSDQRPWPLVIPQTRWTLSQQLF